MHRATSVLFGPCSALAAALPAIVAGFFALSAGAQDAPLLVRPSDASTRRGPEEATQRETKPSTLLNEEPARDGEAAGARSAKRARTKEPDAFSIVHAIRETERAINELRPPLREAWDARLKSRGLDERRERETVKALKDAYFDGVEEWGHAAESCEPEGTSRRWLPRLLKAFAREEVQARRDDMVRVLGSLAAERLSECAQAAEDRALRAERELHAFVADRLAQLGEFLGELEPGTVRASTRFRVSRLEKQVRQSRPLADRSVSLNAIRLRTLAAESDPRVAEHLEDDPAFQKPFSLARALAQLDALSGGPRPKPSGAAKAPSRATQAREPSEAKAQDSVSAPKASSKSKSEPLGSESLTVPWLLQ